MCRAFSMRFYCYRLSHTINPQPLQQDYHRQEPSMFLHASTGLDDVDYHVDDLCDGATDNSKLDEQAVALG
jgi:hypothetical protein